MLKHLILFSVIVIFIILLLVYIFQRHLIYFPALDTPTRQAFDAEDMQSITLTTSDSVNLNAWYKPATDGKPTILYLHGNAGHIGHRMYLARQFMSQGLGILLLDYRGYGGNKGRPTEEGLYQDGRAAVYFLRHHAIENNQLILYGESLGTGIAIKLATEFPICALILQSPYTSLKAVASHHYPFLFIPPQDKYDSLSRIKQINTHLLILHGKKDNIVPYSLGHELFEQANEPKQWVEFPDRGHNDLWDTKFIETVNHFIGQLSCLKKIK